MSDDANLALFCDFENIALGVRDARYAKFDMRLILERLLLKGSIVVKKAYCDWDRYRDFTTAMHEAAFELIEIPHVRQSGKNSADIRMVVDALDLCYTKEHIDTFVIISGDSDFSPLVSKLRENAKTVIGVGVKNSTSDLLISNCDEFIYYDDLAREETQPAKRRRRGGARSRKGPEKPEPVKVDTAKTEPAKAGPDKAAPDKAGPEKAAPGKAAADKPSSKSAEDRMLEAIDLVIETTADLQTESGDRGSLWGSMIKQTLKRRRPGFNESYYGFRSFSDLLEEAEERGLLELELDEKSGGYLVRSVSPDG